MKKYLELIGFFSEFSDEELNEFSRVADVVSTRPKQMIVFEDDPGKGLYFIVNGKFEALKRIEGKKFKRLKKLERGDFFGEMSLLNDATNSASVFSQNAGTLIFLSREAYLYLCEKKPKLSLSLTRRLAAILSERLRHMNLKYEMTVAQLNKG